MMSENVQLLQQLLKLSCFYRYLDTCPKNDVILFFWKGFCTL